MALSVLLVAVVLVGLLLVSRGMRGRQVDDSPHCRRCGYDLSGRPDTSTRCSECGEDLSVPGAVVIGHRQRRIGALITGAVLCALGLFIGTTILIPIIRDLDPIHYKPSSWLIRDLRSDSATVVQAALAELRRRVVAGKLSKVHAQKAAEHILAVQADASLNWIPLHGQLVEAARRADLLADEQWITYLRQGFKVFLVSRPNARQGDPMPMQARPDGRRLGDVHFLAHYEWEFLRVAGHDTSLPAEPDQAMMVAPIGNVWNAARVGPDGSVTRALGPGTHEVVASLRLDVWDISPGAHAPYDGWFPDSPPILSETRDLTKLVEILSADADVAVFVADPELQPPVAEAISIKLKAMPSGGISWHIRTEGAPVRLIGKFVIRFPDGIERTIAESPGSTHWETGAASPRTEVGDLTEVDVVFIPNLDPSDLLWSLDTTPAWGEEVVIRVPIDRAK